MRHRRRNSSASRASARLRAPRPRPPSPPRASAAPVPTAGRATATCAIAIRFASRRQLTDGHRFRAVSAPFCVKYENDASQKDPIPLSNSPGRFFPMLGFTAFSQALQFSGSRLYLPCAGVSFLSAGAEAKLGAGAPLLPETRSQPAEHRKPRGGALCPAGPPRSLRVGPHRSPGEQQMMVLMEMTMWPTGSRRSTSSTGFGSG